MYIPIAFFFFCFMAGIVVCIVWLMDRVGKVEDELRQNELLNNIKAAKKEKGNDSHTP